jgi:hypothetical protein
VWCLCGVPDRLFVVFVQCAGQIACGVCAVRRTDCVWYLCGVPDRLLVVFVRYAGQIMCGVCAVRRTDCVRCTEHPTCTDLLSNGGSVPVIEPANCRRTDQAYALYRDALLMTTPAVCPSLALCASLLLAGILILNVLL